MRVSPQTAGEALTEVQAGRVMSCTITHVRGADAVLRSGRPYHKWRKSRVSYGPRAVQDLRHVWKFHAREPGDPTGVIRQAGWRRRWAIRPAGTPVGSRTDR